MVACRNTWKHERVKGLTQPSIQHALLLHLFARQETEDVQPVLDHDDDEVAVGCVYEVLPVEDVLSGVAADAADVEPAAVDPDEDGFLWLSICAVFCLAGANVCGGEHAR